MSEKNRTEASPYLKHPEWFERDLTKNVATSTAIELGTLPAYILRALEKDQEQTDEP